MTTNIKVWLIWFCIIKELKNVKGRWIILFIYFEKQTWNKTKVAKEIRMQGQKLWDNDNKRKTEKCIKKRMQIVAKESKESIKLKEAEKMQRILDG